MTTVKNPTPRIYVACLSSYNNGKLHGTWIDCTDEDNENNDVRPYDDIWLEIQVMLAYSPSESAEEFAIHDYQNWQGLTINEHESIEQVVKLAALLKEHGAAYSAYYQYRGEDDLGFAESYIGEYESEESFAREKWEQEGRIEQLEALGIQDHWIDWKAIAYDLFADAYFSVNMDNGKAYVFCR